MKSLVRDDIRRQKAEARARNPDASILFQTFCFWIQVKEKELLNLFGTRLLVEQTVLSLTHSVKS